jgi:hypothetical protein
MITEWKHVKERLERHLSSWKDKLLFLGGRLVLINLVLTNMTLYTISSFQVPKGVLHQLNYFQSILFCHEDSEKQKYRLTKSSIVYRPKYQGGLCVQDLQVKNTSLLGKWLSKLLTEEGV